MTKKQYGDEAINAAPREYKLNVIIHGLWAMESNDREIRLTTPDMGTDHVIKAGQVRDITNGTPEIDLQHAGVKSFRLRGVIAGTPKDFSKDLTFLVPFDGSPKHADLTKMALEILLDYPDEIRAVRHYPTASDPFFEGDFPKTPPENAAMVQVLVYRFTSLDALKLEPATWTPLLNPDGYTVNLHLYAQPEVTPPSGAHHAEHGYAMLSAAFGLRMKPVRQMELPDPVDPGIPGLGLIDTQALFEFGPALSPPNCDPCGFDNTSP